MDLHEESESEKNLVSATFELPGLVRDNDYVDVHGNRLIVSAESNGQKNTMRMGSRSVRGTLGSSLALFSYPSE
jgi:HSP20 family protein